MHGRCEGWWTLHFYGYVIRRLALQAWSLAYIYDLVVSHVLSLMLVAWWVPSEPGPSSALSFKYNLGRRCLSPAIFLHHWVYIVLWQRTSHDPRSVRCARTRVLSEMRRVRMTRRRRVAGRGAEREPRPSPLRPRARHPPPPRAVCTRSLVHSLHMAQYQIKRPARDERRLPPNRYTWTRQTMQFIDANDITVYMYLSTHKQACRLGCFTITT